MQKENPSSWRYFLTYSGVKLPLKLTSELQENETENRNTYFRAAYDERGQMVLCQKLVYGELEMEHRYRYYSSGALEEAEITMDGEKSRQIRFADSGELLD
jgi:hypothetical protein